MPLEPSNWNTEHGIEVSHSLYLVKAKLVYQIFDCSGVMSGAGEFYEMFSRNFYSISRHTIKFTS